MENVCYKNVLFIAKRRHLRSLDAQLEISAMAAELDFTPPEIPEPTVMENILHYGLFFGAIFQLICVLAIILPIPKSHKTVSSSFYLWKNQ